MAVAAASLREGRVRECLDQSFVVRAVGIMASLAGGLLDGERRVGPADSGVLEVVAKLAKIRGGAVEESALLRCVWVVTKQASARFKGIMRDFLWFFLEGAVAGKTQLSARLGKLELLGPGVRIVASGAIAVLDRTVNRLPLERFLLFRMAAVA